MNSMMRRTKKLIQSAAPRQGEKGLTKHSKGTAVFPKKNRKFRTLTSLSCSHTNEIGPGSRKRELCDRDSNSRRVDSSPSNPPLLLGGDEYSLSADGVARTLYRVKGGLTDVPPSVSIEEMYDLHNARKMFLLRQDRPPEVERSISSNEWSVGNVQENESNKNRIIPLGPLLQTVKLQEIDFGTCRGAGTGAMTWESSVVFSVLCKTHPTILRGDILELGCGVGLGGILYSTDCHHANSITLTDNNSDVLNQCRRNVFSSRSGNIPMYVSALDWYDAVREPKRHTHKYDTIIACDCAYRSPDIVALVATMKAALRDEQSRIHVLGPDNRGGFQELIRHLKQDDSLSVAVHTVDLQKFRMKPRKGFRRSDFSDHWERSAGFTFTETQSAFVSSVESTFLYLICQMRGVRDKMPPIYDID